MMPSTAYAVCTTPRSGSGLLCEALWDSGVAGRPDEYFFEGTQAEYSRSWGTQSDSTYLARVREHASTPNGVLGFKIMWEHMARFVNCSAKVRGRTGALTGGLEEMFPGLRYVWLRRRDKVRQAVSLWRLLETGVSHRFGAHPMTSTTRPRFDYVAIHGLVRRLEEWDACWQSYFAHHHLSPLELVYEDHLDRGWECGLRRALDFIAIPVPEPLTLHIRRKKMSDAFSEELVQSYRRLAGAVSENSRQIGPTTNGAS